MNSNTESFTVDLSNCEREPIHILGKVQPHSVLMSLREPEFIIEQISESCLKHFDVAVDDLLNQPVETLIGRDYFEMFQDIISSKNLESTPHYLPPLKIGKNNSEFEGLIHRYKGNLILEFERFQKDRVGFKLRGFSAIKNSLSILDKTETVKGFCQAAAEQIREFTGFDRVMVYKFLEDNSGHVLAEAVREDLEPYLGLHYPASDIPRQARELYLKQWLRLIVDVNVNQSPIIPQINPADNEPLDLSYAVTRSMSPIHIEYLKNIGAAASMSISIIEDGKLWGLIACHHGSPKYVPHEIRMACEFLAQTISLQLDLKEKIENREYILKLQKTQDQLIKQMAAEEFYYKGLVFDTPNLLIDFDADGAALVLENEIHLQGKTPDEDQIREICKWLWEEIDRDIYSANDLSGVFDKAADYIEIASGILAIRLTKYKPEYIIWFRKEYKHSIKWAGNPDKAVAAVGKFGDRLTPRQSFAEWQQTVVGKSKSWKRSELDYALGLRRAIVEVTVKKAESLAKQNEELERSNTDLDSFSYIASHDLKEPLRGIYNFSNFLIEDYEEKLEPEAVEQLKTISKLSERMDLMLENLLQYSRIGRLDMSDGEIDLSKYVPETLFLIKNRIEENNAEIRIPQTLPTVYGDTVRLGEVFTNLVSNAIKYNDSENKLVEIGFEESESNQPTVFYVRDNGIGIEKDYHREVFQIFKRLHGRDDYGGGSGAGLTIVQKIIQRHGGKIWLESDFGKGTTFYFTLDGEEKPAKKSGME